MNPAGLIPALQHHHNPLWWHELVGPTDHCDCNKWWHGGVMRPLDLILGLSICWDVQSSQPAGFSPVIYPDSDLTAHHSLFFTMLPTGLAFHVLDELRSSQLALQPRGVPSLCYAPCYYPPPLPSHPLIPRGCFLFSACSWEMPSLSVPGKGLLFLHTSCSLSPCLIFPWDPNNLPVYLIPTAPLLHSTPNSDVSSMGIEVAQFQPGWHVLKGFNESFE